MNSLELQDYINWVSTDPIIPANKTYLDVYKDIKKRKKNDLIRWF